MPRKKLKLFITLLCFIIFMFFLVNTVFAANGNFDLDGWDGVSSEADDEATQTMSTIVRIVQIAGSGMALIMMAYMGIKYMISAPEGKAEFKNSMRYYLWGAFLVFVGSNIVAIIWNFANNDLN